MEDEKNKNIVLSVKRVSLPYSAILMESLIIESFCNYLLKDHKVDLLCLKKRVWFYCDIDYSRVSIDPC